MIVVKYVNNVESDRYLLLNIPTSHSVPISEFISSCIVYRKVDVFISRAKLRNLLISACCRYCGVDEGKATMST